MGAKLQASDYIGKIYGRLKVIDLVYVQKKGKYKQAYFVCECTCGTLKEIYVPDVKNGKTQSCGCLCKERGLEANTTHGQRHTRLYGIWYGMIKRCENQNEPAYKHYGERGIAVCEPWHDFSCFSKWAYDNGYDENAPLGKCTIERQDNDMGYSPDNCRWADMATQSRNRRVRKTSESGVTGVSFHKQVGKWQANIMANGEYIYLGCFDTIEAAANARAEGELKYW